MSATNSSGVTSPLRSRRLLVSTTLGLLLASLVTLYAGHFIQFDET